MAKKIKIESKQIIEENFIDMEENKNLNFPKRNIKFIVSAVINIILIVGIIVGYLYMNDKVLTERNSYERNSEHLSDLKKEKNRLESELNELNGIYTTKYTKLKLDFIDESIVFVIEGYGNYYYSYDCMLKKTSGNGEYSYWAYNIDAAKSQGYRKGGC